MEKISNFKLVFEKEGQMHVPAVIYTTEKLYPLLFKDNAINQLKNVASLPGIEKYALGMPDIHEGYGFPIGGVAAFDVRSGVVSPGGVGFDINCGVRVIKTNILSKDIKNRIKEMGNFIFNTVPSGLGSKGTLKFTKNDVKRILNSGLRWTENSGFAISGDRESTEEEGFLKNADAHFVSDRAVKRGREELGTLGAGNHFLEIDEVEEVFDKETADALGLFKGQVIIWIHTGSRGLGHQVASDYIDLMRNRMNKYGIPLIDRDLVSLPILAPESGDYIAAMSAAANFAWVNRQIITHLVRSAFAKFFRISPERLGMFLLYDVAHNIAKFEKYNTGGEEKMLLVHRKGATRAFPPNHPELSEKFKKTGQPVLLPGDMKAGSYIFVGAENSVKESFGSVSHGAGRALSRHKALKRISFEEVLEEMSKENIVLIAKNRRIAREEAPEAYKEINEVIKPIEANGLARKVVRSKPLFVIKG